MNTFRLPAAALAVSMLFAVAWSFSAVGCGQSGLVIYACAQPTPTEIGADGGPDPCHCNPPEGSGCPCTDPDEYNQSGLTGVQIYQVCVQSLADAGDAAEGGP